MTVKRPEDFEILIGCENSGMVRDAFIRRGFKAMSCDLLPTASLGPHHQGDLLEFLRANLGRFRLMIAHPDCTFLSVSGMHWNTNPKSYRFGGHQTRAALQFVAALFESEIESVAIENPISIISTHFRKPDQIIQPHQFGEDASKATCLWLKNLPKLKGTSNFPPRLVEWPRGSGKMRQRWSNQTDSGQNRLGPSEDRWKLRSLTYQGIADAFAQQWGDYLLGEKS